MFDLPGDVAPQGFAYKSDKEDITPKLFDMTALPEGSSIYYIFLKKPSCFIQRRSKMWLEQSRSG